MTVIKLASQAVNWLLIKTKSNMDHVAERSLQRRDHGSCTVYFPKIQTTIRHARRVRDVVKPFLPGYGFVADDGQSYREIRSAPGVLGLVRTTNNDLAHASQRVIDLIRSREVDGTVRIEEKVREVCGWKQGDELRVTDDASPFWGLNVIFRVRDGKDRALVFLSLMSRRVSTTLPLSSMEPV